MRLTSSDFVNFYFYYVKKNKFLVFFDITSATKRVSTSAAGNASHTPVIPRNFGRINANAMIATIPLVIDTIEDYFAWSVALKNPAKIILIAAAKKPAK